MAEFQMNYISKSKLNDQGVSVSELLELLNDDELTKALLKALKVEECYGQFINIPGAEKLVKTQKGINKRFHKEDLVSSLNDITIYNGEDFSINFCNLQNSEYFSKLGLSELITEPKYSSKSDFFSWLFSMDKYATELIRNGLYDILNTNIDLLKELEISKEERKYRILHDLNTDKFYLRAIISLMRYNNYDNNITIVIALLCLHRRMQKENINYSLNRIEYNESRIKLFFEEKTKRKIGEIGYVINLIEVSNDEVKREALKFNAISYIEFIDTEDQTQELIIQPRTDNKRIKTVFLSISHGSNVKTFIDSLVELDNSAKIHNELFELINKISNITNPLQIIFLIKSKINSSRADYFKQYKNKAMKMLESQTVTNMIQLLTLFKKIELLAENDIDASEYIRYIIYESLIDGKK